MDKFIYFPMDSEQMENGEEDRAFSSEEFASYFASFVGNGIFPNPANQLKVQSKYGNMVVTVEPGMAWINGRYYKSEDVMDITIEPSSSSLRRIDSINVEFSAVERLMHVVYIKGITATNPKPTDLIRNADKWQLRLAQITVLSGAANVSSSNILDTRFDNSQCGLVTGIPNSVDTTELFNQYDKYLKEKQIEWNSFELAQKQDWEAQMQQQQDDFDTFQDIMNGWKNLTVTELAQAVTFHFENQFSYPGTIKDADLSNPSMVKETLKFKSSGLMLCEQITTFPSDTVVTAQKVYNTDGSIFRSVKATTTFPSGNPRTEVEQL